MGRSLHLGKAGSAPADRLKRACGLCVCLAGALMEVMSFGFWYLSNPVHSYVKCWRVHASFGEDLWCLQRGRLMRKWWFFPEDVTEERKPVRVLELLTRKEVALGREVSVSRF